MISTQAFALSGKMTGGFPDKGTFQHTADDYNAQCRAGYGQFPQGLTFYKDFTKIPAGTYLNSTMGNYLNADYSIGDPKATFSSTSGSFTITSNGYQATTANDEVLKYLIANNRTAAQETIIIKFTPTGDFANDGNYRQITTTETKNRCIYKANSSDKTSAQGNASDSGTSNAISTTVLLNGVTYIISGVFFPTNNPNSSLYVGTSLENSSNNDFTVPAWGTSFAIGSSISGFQQANGIFGSVCFFNRVLTLNEIAIVCNLI